MKKPACKTRRRVSFRSSAGTVSFMAVRPGCPKPEPTAAQLELWERFGDVSKTCARLDDGNDVVERAKNCVGPRMRGAAEPEPEPSRPSAPPPTRTITTPKLKKPADLKLEAFRSKKLRGACQTKAQELAETFCKRFTYNADLPGLSGAVCFNNVRQVFLEEACRGK